MFYENYLNSLKADTSYIPECASITDIAVFAERACQDAFNEAFFSLASQEMAVFEAAILEADGEAAEAAAASPEKKKGLLEIIKKAVSTIWEKIKGAFSKMFGAVEEKFKKFKKEAGNKFKEDVKKGAKKLPADKKFKGIYDFEFNLVKEGTEKFAKISSLADRAYTDCAKDDFNFGETYNKAAILKELGFDSAENFKVEGPEKVEVTGAEINANVNRILAVIFDQSHYVKDIKIAYKEAKKNIDGTLKSAKACINKKDKAYADLNKACKELISFCKDCTNIITKYSAMILKMRFNVRANYLALATKLVVQYSGKKEKDQAAPEAKEEPAATNESYKMDSLEERFESLMEEDEVDVEVKEEPAEAPEEPSDDADIEAVADDESEDVEVDVEESALYQALYAYFE